MQQLLGTLDYTIDATPEQRFQIQMGDGVYQDPGVGLQAYTDGSKDKDKVGAVVVVLVAGDIVIRDMQRIHGQCSVFQAELQAIQLAVKYFNAQPPASISAYLIFSDSQAALEALSVDEVTSQLVLNTITELNLLDNVRLSWVQGHGDCLGNNLVDQLAKQASHLPEVSQVLPLPRYEIKQQVLGWVRDRWDAEWELYPLARQTKVFFSNL